MSFENKDGVTDSEPRRASLPTRAVAPSLFWRLVRTVSILVLSAACIVFLGRWLRDEDDSLPQPAKTADGPSIVAEGVERIVIRDKGRRVWEFAARKITITPDRMYAIATDMRQAILYRNDKPYLQLQASQVRLNQQTFDAEATGGVTASGPEGVKIRTERAQWSHQSRVLRCPATVEATLRGLTVQTRDVSYDMSKSKLNCPQKVEVQGKRFHLRGASATVDVKTRRVEFSGATEFVVKQPLR